LQPIAAYCSFWAGLRCPLAASHAIDSGFLMGKNGTGWDVFDGFQSHLAVFGNETGLGSAEQSVLVISCSLIGSSVVKSRHHLSLRRPGCSGRNPGAHFAYFLYIQYALISRFH